MNDNDDFDKFIQDRFPQTDASPTPRRQCKKFIETRTRNHDFFLIEVITWLKRIVGSKQPSPGRFVCRLDERNCKKHWESIAEKLHREQHEGGCTWDDFHKKLKDIVRLRIVCNFLSDVRAMQDNLTQAIKNDAGIQGAVQRFKEKNTIDERPGARKSAHRSIKIILESRRFQGVFLEIQIMTQLQEAWDNKDHHLIYELHRSSPDSDESNFMNLEDSKMYAMAELLYIADDYFDQLKNQLEE